MYWHTDDPIMVQFLADVFAQAAANGNKVRILTDASGLRLKVGEGMWTAPFTGTPDPYRDH